MIAVHGLQIHQSYRQTQKYLPTLMLMKTIVDLSTYLIEEEEDEIYGPLVRALILRTESMSSTSKSQLSY